MGPGEISCTAEKIYNKVKLDYPSLCSKTALAVTVYGLNNSANSEGLIPTLFLFGTIPKLPIGNAAHLQADQKERFLAMEAAKKQIDNIVAKQRIKLASKRYSVKAMEALNVEPGEEVWVYREKLKH